MSTETKPARDDHEHADGCLCGHERAEHEATADHDLPAAAGGIVDERKSRKPRRKGTRTNVEGEA